MRQRLLNAARRADILEVATAFVVIENVRCAGQTARPAHHRRPLPHATRLRSRRRRRGQIEVNVVCDNNIQPPIAVVVNKGAASAPLLAGAGRARLRRDIAKRTIALIVEQMVLTVGSDVEIVVPIVVIVAHTSALSPTAEVKASLGGDISKCSVVVVVKQVARRWLS